MAVYVPEIIWLYFRQRKQQFLPKLTTLGSSPINAFGTSFLWQCTPLVNKILCICCTQDLENLLPASSVCISLVCFKFLPDGPFRSRNLFKAQRLSGKSSRNFSNNWIISRYIKSALKQPKTILLPLPCLNQSSRQGRLAWAYFPKCTISFKKKKKKKKGKCILKKKRKKSHFLKKKFWRNFPFLL